LWRDGEGRGIVAAFFHRLKNAAIMSSAKTLLKPPSIRQLTLHDGELFRQLMACFAAAFEDAETYLSSPPSDAYLGNLLAADHFIALAALSADSTVIGGLTAYELKKFEQERREIYIYDLAVAETQRRQGIATAVIERLQQIARNRDAYVIYVQADLGDPPAIALYSKLGRREDVLHFDFDPA